MRSRDANAPAARDLRLITWSPDLTRLFELYQRHPDQLEEIAKMFQRYVSNVGVAVVEKAQRRACCSAR